MREINYTARFKRDYRRIEDSGKHGRKRALLMEVVNLLAADTPLRRRCRSRTILANGTIIAVALRPDLILIYRKADGKRLLDLVRLGSLRQTWFLT